MSDSSDRDQSTRQATASGHARSLLRPMLVSALCWIAPLAFLLVSTGCSQAEDFSDDLESGVLAEELWQIDGAKGCSIELTDRKAASGRYSIEFIAPPRARCEVVPRVFSGWIGKFRHEPFGEERWYAFSTYLAEPWPDNAKNEIIAQWHANRDAFVGDVPARGPPLAIRLYGGQFVITQGADADFVSDEQWIARTRLWNGPVVAGRWLHWKVQARWSYEDDGMTRIWLNDELIVDDQGPNTYNDLRGVYLKLGPYHPDQSRTMYIDDVHVGNSEPRFDDES